jgi:signal transduction histidine kinase/CheY-like chemotaxis protein
MATAHPHLAASADIFDEHRAEIGQAKTRFAMIVASTIYLLIRGSGVGPTPLSEDRAIHLALYFLGYAVFGSLLFAHIKRYPGYYPLRRLTAMFGDYGSLAYVMIVGGEPAMPFYALILWVTVGNGMRFGQRYLLIAAIMAQLSVIALVAGSTYWRSQPELMITFSIAAFALPTYALVLLRQTAKARDAAIAAMLAKSRFLAQASHDLRQPVHAIGYHIEALRDSRINRTQVQLVDRIERALGGVARLFKSLLDISKLDSGTLEVRPETVALQPFLLDIVQQYEKFANWHGVDLRFVPTTLSVRADPALLATMIQNLLSNAIKYSRGSKVLLGTRRKAGTVSIEVHDRGIGIEAQHLDNIFDEFYRAHVSGDHDIEGVGLGLAIVKRLASMGGFAVDLNSSRGKGTSVRLSNIPVSIEYATRSTSPANVAPQPLARLRVILIEDDLDVLDATAQLLRKWGCVVQAAPGLPQNPIDADAIVADFDLGNGTKGADAIEAIRHKLGRLVPAILVTGHAEDSVKRQIQGPDIGLLTKPVQPATLRSTLSSIRLGLIDQP